MTVNSKRIIDSVVEATNDPPTYVMPGGSKEWRDKNLKLHRIGAPAIVRPNGDTCWYVDGKLHREDGPALDWTNGHKTWYKNGMCHRIDGPASIVPGHGCAYFVGGRRFTEDEFNLYVDQETGEVLVPPGKKLTYDPK